MPRPSRLHVLGLVLLLAVLAGCERVEPHALRVTAPDTGALARWRRSVATRFSATEWRDFDAALQQIRAQISATSESRGEAAIDTAMCAMIDGRTWREIQLLGAEAELQRLSALRLELKKNIEGNALLITRGNDSDSARRLREIRERQQQRLSDFDAQIATVTKRLVALGGTPLDPSAGAADAGATALSRGDARLQIDTLMAGRRARAQFRFGAWPVKLDRDGSLITGDVRDEFLAARAAAQKDEAVIAVRLKDRWWIYRGLTVLPQFSSAVMANLTLADYAAIKRAWVDLDAEIWAREQAWDQPSDATTSPRAKAPVVPRMALPAPRIEIAPPDARAPIIAPEKPPPPQLP